MSCHFWVRLQPQSWIRVGRVDTYSSTLGYSTIRPWRVLYFVSVRMVSRIDPTSWALTSIVWAFERSSRQAPRVKDATWWSWWPKVILAHVLFKMSESINNQGMCVVHSDDFLRPLDHLIRLSNISILFDYSLHLSMLIPNSLQLLGKGGKSSLWFTRNPKFAQMGIL